MLLRIHDHIAHKEPEDACSAPHCISHQKFAMTLVEQSVCDNCRATTEPMSFTQVNINYNKETRKYVMFDQITENLDGELHWYLT